MQPTNPNQPAADDHAPMGRPSEETIRRGYEEDRYDAKSVISVPLLVILFFVLAFGTVTVIFKFIAYPKGDPRAHPAAAERNKRPLNDRLAGIGNDGQGGKSTREQPRLDVLRRRDPGHGEHDLSRAITRPETKEGNSPELHPEDLRVTKDRFPMLYESTGGKVSIDKVMGLSDEKALGSLFPVQKNGTKPIESQHLPTNSNAGRGASESPVTVPAAPKLEAKKDDKKTDPMAPKIPTAPDPKPGGKQ